MNLTSNKHVYSRFGLLGTIIGFSLFAPTLMAQSLCTTTTLAAFTTCTIDGYTLSLESFSATSDYSYDYSQLFSESQIDIVPTVVDGNISIQFQTADGAPFAITSGDAQYLVEYELDPVAPRVTGTSIDLGPNDPVTLNGYFCGNDSLSNACHAGTPLSLLLAPTEPDYSGSTVSGTFPTLQTDLDTELELKLNGDTYTQSFGAITYLTPEPSVSLLLPIMLAGLWLAKKKSDRRKTAATAEQ